MERARQKVAGSGWNDESVSDPNTTFIIIHTTINAINTTPVASSTTVIITPIAPS
jgi:hypothetical protein